MKRQLTILLAALLLVSAMTACGTTADEIQTTADVPAEQTSAEPETAPPEQQKNPYELTYTSLGDGTCKVSDITIHPAYRENFTLTIPATSPDGKRVVAVENPGGFAEINVPYILLPEDFEAFRAMLTAHFGADDTAVRYITDSYVSVSRENYPHEELWNYMEVGLIEHTDFYLLDTSSNEAVLMKMADWIYEADPTYTAYEAEKKVQDIAAAHGLTLKWQFDTIRVDRVNDSARFVESIVLEDGIQTIGDGAFRNARAVSLTLPADLTEIGEEAFYHCRSLAEVRWPTAGKLRRIGAYAFSMATSMTSVTLAGDGLIVEDNAFGLCQLTDLTLGGGVASVDGAAFAECLSLQNLHITDDVTELDPSAFRWVGGREYIRMTFGENSRLTSIGDEFFTGYILYDTTLPRSLTYLGYHAIGGGMDLRYAGTVAEWEAIEKHAEWFTAPLTVSCTDGDVTT